MIFPTISDENRRLKINWDAVNTYASRWKPGTWFEVSIKRRKATVSDPMRRYYWSTVLPPFLEAIGYEKDEDLLVHRQLKIVYFRVEPDKRGIYREKDIPSVFSNNSKVPVSEKTKFLEWVIRKAAQEGVYIPSPGDDPALPSSAKELKAEE